MESNKKQAACTCGSASVGSDKHSDWCDSHKREIFSGLTSDEIDEAFKKIGQDLDSWYNSIGGSNLKNFK